MNIGMAMLAGLLLGGIIGIIANLVLARIIQKQMIEIDMIEAEKAGIIEQLIREKNKLNAEDENIYTMSEMQTIDRCIDIVKGANNDR